MALMCIAHRNHTGVIAIDKRRAALTGAARRCVTNGSGGFVHCDLMRSPTGCGLTGFRYGGQPRGLVPVIARRDAPLLPSQSIELFRLDIGGPVEDLQQPLTAAPPGTLLQVLDR